MANTFFQFKQFKTEQAASAMKVTTDGCLFGAWAAAGVAREATYILDIGTGTGLLSLMLAQENKRAKIDAVEMDAPAAAEAGANFKASPWSKRLQVCHTTIQEYAPELVQPYDFIICNPPFFNKDLKSKQPERNLAMHSEALGLEELLDHISRLLAIDGKFALLLPFHRLEEFEILAVSKDFYPEEKIFVHQSTQHDCFRVMLLFSRQSHTPQESNLAIRDEFNDYSETFTSLLQPYYLYL